MIYMVCTANILACVGGLWLVRIENDKHYGGTISTADSLLSSVFCLTESPSERCVISFKGLLFNALSQNTIWKVVDDEYITGGAISGLSDFVNQTSSSVEFNDTDIDTTWSPIDDGSNIFRLDRILNIDCNVSNLVCVLKTLFRTK